MRNDLESSRSFTMTLGHRAVRDIRRDGFRQLRNYVDMCAVLAKKDSQKHFFEYAQTVLERTDSLYYTLVRRLVEEVSEDRICSVGINLGFDSLIYGVSHIRASERTDLSWLHVGICGTPGLECAVAAAEQEFCYTWVLSLEEPLTDDTVAVFRAHPYTAFFLLAEPEQLTEETILRLEHCNNVVVLIFLHKPELTPEACAAACRMRRRRMFCGFLVDLGNDDAAEAFDADWLDVITQYSLFCIYARKPDMSAEMSEQLHRQIVSSRRETVSVPIFLLDWERDLRSLSCLTSTSCTVGTCLPEGRTFPLQLGD